MKRSFGIFLALAAGTLPACDTEPEQDELHDVMLAELDEAQINSFCEERVELELLEEFAELTFACKAYSLDEVEADACEEFNAECLSYVETVEAEERAQRSPADCQDLREVDPDCRGTVGDLRACADLLEREWKRVAEILTCDNREEWMNVSLGDELEWSPECEAVQGCLWHYG